MIKTCKVELDPITSKLAEAFDYTFTGESQFEVPKFSCPEEFSVGLIVGNSGSGKTSILKEYFKLAESPSWNSALSVASHFGSFENACEKLFAVGLASIPTLCRPYHVLSNGEQYRARMARYLDLADSSQNIAIDEFTSVVDRNVAKGICVSLRKYLNKKKGRTGRIVFASCHYDIIEWLEPDFVFDISSKSYIVNQMSLGRFPKLGGFIIK